MRNGRTDLWALLIILGIVLVVFAVAFLFTVHSMSESGWLTPAPNLQHASTYPYPPTE
jgi:flagellar basal body-associated protein FliL